MKETLAMLVELQRLEDELRDLRTAKLELDKLTRENAESLEVFDRMLADRAARIEETRAFTSEKESEIKDAEEQARRSRARLQNITSQRELNAVNKELENQRRTTQQRSEELLKLMEQLEAAEADHQRRTGERDALAAQMRDVEKEKRAEIGERQKHASEHMQRRDEIRRSMDKQLLARFDRISRGRGGQVVADVADGACGACRVAVPPQVFIRLQRMETLESCMSCKRLLVYRAGLAGEAGPAPA